MTSKELLYLPPALTGRASYTERVRRLFTEYLAQRGLRLTRQRLRILDHLLSTDKHLGLEQIYGVLRPSGLGRATVFRTLKMLEECRLVSRVTAANGSTRFELHIERPHHDHLICLACGGIQEVRWPGLERIQAKSCRSLGFSPEWHRHEVFGRCADCRRKAG